MRNVADLLRAVREIFEIQNEKLQERIRELEGQLREERTSRRQADTQVQELLFALQEAKGEQATPSPRTRSFRTPSPSKVTKTPPKPVTENTVRASTPPHGSVVEVNEVLTTQPPKPMPVRPDSSWLGDDDSDEDGANVFPFVSSRPVSQAQPATQVERIELAQQSAHTAVSTASPVRSRVPSQLPPILASNFMSSSSASQSLSSSPKVMDVLTTASMNPPGPKSEPRRESNLSMLVPLQEQEHDPSQGQLCVSAKEFPVFSADQWLDSAAEGDVVDLLALARQERT